MRKFCGGWTKIYREELHHTRPDVEREGRVDNVDVLGKAIEDAADWSLIEEFHRQSYDIRHENRVHLDGGVNATQRKGQNRDERGQNYKSLMFRLVSS
jgi:hypothetical protein